VFLILKIQQINIVGVAVAEFLDKRDDAIMITIANKYHGAKGINIMRGSPLGNPFQIDDNNPRESVIAKYHEWLRNEYLNKQSPAYLELKRLASLVIDGNDITLVCCCHPKSCHGDVIKTAIEGMIKKSRCQMHKNRNI